MSNPPTLGCLLESFFHRHLVEQRNASPATLASYRDAKGRQAARDTFILMVDAGFRINEASVLKWSDIDC